MLWCTSISCKMNTALYSQVYWGNPYKALIILSGFKGSKWCCNVGPLYIKDLLPLAKDKGKGLRSSKDPLLLEDPQIYRSPYGDRSFSAAGPREWNNLPLSIRQSPTINSFISSLKTRLFKIAYNCQWHLHFFFFIFLQYLWTVIYFWHTFNIKF